MRWLAIPVLVFVGCASSPRPKTSYAEEIGGSTGEPICDEYLWKLKTCAEHEALAESQRPAMRELYTKYRDAWTNVPARDPETRASIVEACNDGVKKPSPSYDNMCPNVFF